MATEQHKGRDKQLDTGSRTKLSSSSHTHNKRQCVHFDSGSKSSDSDQSFPTLDCIRKSSLIQHQVDRRIRELEQQSEMAGIGNKLKSKCGGNVDVLVKNKVTWLNEAILGWINRSRVTL